MNRVSQKLRAAIKLGNKPAYVIAIQADLHPCTLSKLLHGAELIKIDDERVISVGRILGIPPEECFEEERETAAAHERTHQH